jgi:hypothetical protein
VPDLPDHLAKVVSELESRKESLRNRIESLDSVISGIHERHEAPPAGLAVPAGLSIQTTLETEAPLREQAGSSYQPRPRPDRAAIPVTLERDDVPGVAGGLRPAEQQLKPLKRVVPKAELERRQPAHLNVYVNRNAEWAAQQFVSSKSPRAVFRHKTGHRCPNCGSQDTRLSVTRGVADWFMFLFDYSLARCRNCDTRFRIWRSRPDAEEGEGERVTEARPSNE